MVIYFAGVSLAQDNYTFQNGKTVSIKCNVSSVSRVKSVWWKRMINGVSTIISSVTEIDRFAGSTPDTPSLVILVISKEDAGVYTCFVTTGMETSHSEPATVQVVDCGKFVRPYQINL